MVEKIIDIIEINVIKDYKFNNYLCIVKEILKFD